MNNVTISIEMRIEVGSEVKPGSTPPRMALMPFAHTGIETPAAKGDDSMPPARPLCALLSFPKTPQRP